MKNIDLDFIASQIAAQILSEETDIAKSEKERQDAVSKEIKGDDLDAPPKDKDEQSRLTDEGEESEDEESIDPKPKPDPDSDDDDSEDFETKAAKSVPRTLTLDDMKDQINNLRAGKSLKDEAVSGQLEDYFKMLGQGEEKALYVFLSSLAAILTGGTPGEDAPRPESMGIDITLDKKKEKKSQGKPKPGVGEDGEQAPIIVGETADTSRFSMRLLESLSSEDFHRCLDGRLVKFGSKGCQKDLRSRIEDAAQLRDDCPARSADRASLNGTLKYLRQKLRAAEKIASVSKR